MVAMHFNFFRNNKWVRRAALVVVSVVVVWGLAWLVLPGIAKNQLEKVASEQLGRKVSVGAVSLRPWSLELTLDDLAMAQADGATPQVQIKRIYIDAEMQSLLRLAPVVDALRIEGLAAKLTHLGDGRYDVDDILDRLAASPSSGPKPMPQFALYNLTLQGASLDYVDQPVNKTHELRELSFSIPFLSNLGSLRDVKTEPRLAFKLNGAYFDSAAQTTPFSMSRKTDAEIHLKDWDVRPYLPYWPKSLPVKLQAGVVGLDVRLAFEQSDLPSVKLSGTVELKGVRASDAKEQDLLAFDALHVVLDDVRPLAQVIKLGAVELTRPNLALRRDKAGRINLLNLANAQLAAAKGTPAAGSGKGEAIAQPYPHPWKVDIAKIAVRTGQVHWSDESTMPRARLDLNELTLDASGLTWPFARPVQLAGAFVLAAPPVDGRSGRPLPVGPASRLSFTGSATDKSASVTALLDGLSLSLASPYLSQVLAPGLEGRLSGQLGVKWTAPDVQLQATALTVSNLTLVPSSGAAKAAPVVVKSIEVAGAQVDLRRQAVTVEKLAINQPSVVVTRGKDKRWMYEDWLKPAPGAAANPVAEPGKPLTVAKPWRVAVKDFFLQGGTVQYGDRATTRPVVLEVSALSVQMKDVATDSKKPGPLKVSAKIKTRRGEPGQLDFSGALAMQPLAVRGQVQATRIPAHAFAPYLTDVLNLRLQRADAGFKGVVSYTANAAGPLFKLRGDVLLEELLANALSQEDAGADALAMGQELLSCKALNLQGLDVAVVPGQATTVAVDESALTDFYARVIISETGRINLQDLVKPSAGSPADSDSAPAGSAPAAVIRMGPISLTNGRVLFSDHFVKPNYTANLTDLAGKLSAFSTAPVISDANAVPAPAAMADLELHGLAEGSASLEIVGKLNPLVKPLALDIKGRVHDLELSPLSPYSVKYAGHGIERGKLSMDVAYQVQPDGHLLASNKLVLNQLVFGDPVEGAPNSLPVRLAVALLADRNGVIDINLPISGSLNDPEFRVGSIIFKLIVNLISKALTSPFSLLSAAFGGGDELGQVAFAPGSAELGAEAKASLDKVIAAMKERPALSMTVVGAASLEVERGAFRRERLNALMLEEKRRSAVVAGKPANDASAVSEAEKPVLLKAVYRRAQMPKPRNLLGLVKNLPEAEMETLLLTNMEVTEEHMRELAQARAMVVKDYFSRHDMPLERLFLGATKLVSADAKWAPHAELHLAMQ